MGWLDDALWENVLRGGPPAGGGYYRPRNEQDRLIKEWHERNHAARVDQAANSAPIKAEHRIGGPVPSITTI